MNIMLQHDSSELKSHDVVIFYKSCGHFFCTDCNEEKKSCMICFDREDVAVKLTDDKNMFSLYESILNLKLPSRREIEEILESCQPPSLDSSSVVNSTESNDLKPGLAFTKVQENVLSKQKNNAVNSKSEVLLKQPEKLKRVTRSPIINSVKKIKNDETPIKPKPVTSNDQKSSTGKKKVNVNKKNHKGETPLHLACKRGSIPEMKSLIDEGADVNAQDHAGWTPLHDSVIKGNLDVIQLLLQKGAKVNTPGLENNTPLHEAVTSMNIKVCELLMKFGADCRSKNITGDTPLDLAKKFKNLEMEEILLHTKPSLNLNSEFKRALTVDGEAIVIWKCQLTETEEEAVKKFSREFNAEIVSTYPFCSQKAVTHIIVPPDKKLELNWPLISSVVSGSWIVDSRWIFDSLKDKTIKSFMDYTLSETFFSGFERSRSNKLNQLPGLFSGCHFFFHGSLVNYYVGKIKIVKDHVISLVKKNGGDILKRSPDPERDLERTVPYHANEKSSIASTSHFIIYQTGKNEPIIKYNMAHLKALPIDWLILCIFRFELIPPTMTEIYLNEFLQE